MRRRSADEPEKHIPTGPLLLAILTIGIVACILVMTDWIR